MFTTDPCGMLAMMAPEMVGADRNLSESPSELTSACVPGVKVSADTTDARMPAMTVRAMTRATRVGAATRARGRRGKVTLQLSRLI